MTKICAISDLHGTLPIINKCDIVLICGDISPLEIQSNHHKCRQWFKTTFAKWAESLPCDQVFFIAGNHDRSLETRDSSEINSWFSSKIKYLCNEGYSYITHSGNLINIYGTPYCHQFGNWAFMYSDEKLAELFEHIPFGLDILMSHDAPYGCSDIVLQEIHWNKGEHIGNPPLREAILEKKPHFVVKGHLHSADHSWLQLGDSKIITCSILDEHYRYNYEPTYFIINK